MKNPETERNPKLEKVALSFTLSQAGWLFAGVQVGATAAIYEITKYIPPETMGEMALSMFAFSAIAGYLYSEKTLEHCGYTFNAVTSLLHLKVANPWVASFVGDLYAHASYFTSPIDMGATFASQTLGDNNHLLFSNLMARSLIGLGVTVGVNWVIREGFTEQLLNRLPAFINHRNSIPSPNSAMIFLPR